MFHAMTMGSSRLQSAETVLLPNPVPHNSSGMALIVRVETPLMTISSSAKIRACSRRWQRATTSVEKWPARTCGMRSVSVPTRVVSFRTRVPFR